MEKPTLYRKKSISDVHNRNLSNLTQAESTEVSNSINKFFELFVLKHLS